MNKLFENHTIVICYNQTLYCLDLLQFQLLSAGFYNAPLYMICIVGIGEGCIYRESEREDNRNTEFIRKN